MPINVDMVDIKSGQTVWISGQHVYVESGVYLASGLAVIPQSGIGVLISGQHVYVESGVYVIADVQVDVSSGIHVLISGQHVYVESGVWVAGLSISGLDIQVNISGDPVIVSGQPVNVSGSHVWISGQHVFVESGVYLASGLSFIQEPPTEVKTADMKSFTNNSGGEVLHSGAINSLTVKAFHDNSGDLFVGGNAWFCVT